MYNTPYVRTPQGEIRIRRGWRDYIYRNIIFLSPSPEGGARAGWLSCTCLVHVSGNHVSINHFSISESRLDPGEKFEERKKNPFQRILPIYEFTIEFITR